MAGASITYKWVQTELSYPTEGVRAGPEDLRQQGEWGHTVVPKLHALCLAEIGAEGKEADTTGEHSLG
jgi:hypothetical protein